jgi:hypothetical protein
MRRRRLLATTTTVTTTLLAGCLGTLTGSSCPDSPTPIENLDQYQDKYSGDAERPTIVGTITTVNTQEEYAIITGDTGKAVITGLPLPDKGKCVRVTGFVTSCAGSDCIEDAYYMSQVRVTDAQTTHEDH